MSEYIHLQRKTSDSLLLAGFVSNGPTWHVRIVRIADGVVMFDGQVQSGCHDEGGRRTSCAHRDCAREHPDWLAIPPQERRRIAYALAGRSDLLPDGGASRHREEYMRRLARRTREALAVGSLTQADLEADPEARDAVALYP